MIQIPRDVALSLAQRGKELRLAQNLTQDGLALRAGVSLGSLKRFEVSGQVALKTLLQIADALGRLDDFSQIFLPAAYRTLDELIAPKMRQRGRRK